MDFNYIREARFARDENGNFFTEEQGICNPIQLENLTVNLEPKNDSNSDGGTPPRPKFCGKSPKAYGDSAEQSAKKSTSRFKRSLPTENLLNSDPKLNRSLPVSARSPAPTPSRMCVSLNPDTLRFLREKCKDFEAKPPPTAPVVPFSGANEGLMTQRVTSQVSLIRVSPGESSLRRMNAMSNLAQRSSVEITMPAADSEGESTERMIVDQSGSSFRFGPAVSLFPVEVESNVPKVAQPVKEQQSSCSVIVTPSKEVRRLSLVHEDVSPQSQRSWMNSDPNPPVVSVMPIYQQDNTREQMSDGSDSSPPPLIPVADFYHGEQTQYPGNFRVNNVEESLSIKIPSFSLGMEEVQQISRDSLMEDEHDECAQNELNCALQFSRGDAQPSTSGLENDVDDSDSDGEDQEQHLRVNLYPPLYKSPSKVKTTSKGSSKYKSVRDKPRNDETLNDSGSYQLSSPDIDPQQVPGFVTVFGHGVRFGPSNLTLTRELNGFRDLPFSSAVVMHMYILFNGFLLSMDIRDYTENLCASSAFHDTTDLEVEFRSDNMIRFAVCQVCGVPRYVRRTGKWQVWSPVEVNVCRHSEPFYFGADFQHVWWNLAHQSGLVPINPSLFPFSLLFARLGDLAELTLATLVVNGVFPILNRMEIPSEWPLGREAYVETDDDLLKTASYGFVKWVRDNEHLGSVASFRFCRSPRLCPLCGGRMNDVRLHYSHKQPLACKAIINLTVHRGLASRVRHLVQQHRPIIWTGRPSVQALLRALANANVIQIDAAAILFCLLGTVALTHDERNPELLNCGPFISARFK